YLLGNGMTVEWTSLLDFPGLLKGMILFGSLSIDSPNRLISFLSRPPFLSSNMRNYIFLELFASMVFPRLLSPTVAHSSLPAFGRVCMRQLEQPSCIVHTTILRPEATLHR